MGNDERRSRWLAVLRKELLFPVLAAVIAGVIVLGFEYGSLRSLLGASGQVSQSQPWDTEGVAEFRGAQSGGKLVVLDDGQVYLTGTVSDTVDDRSAVALQVEITRGSGGPENRLFVNNRGAKQTVPIGSVPVPANGTGEPLGGGVTRVRVHECLAMPNHDGRYAPKPNECGNYKVIYQAK